MSQEEVGCKSRWDLIPLDSIIGQERAVRSLKLGLEIKNQGCNFYVAGGHIDEGIEILTGRKPGEKKDGKFEEGSINDLIDRQLKRFSETMRNFAGPEVGKKEKSPD